MDSIAARSSSGLDFHPNSELETSEGVHDPANREIANGTRELVRSPVAALRNLWAAGLRSASVSGTCVVDEIVVEGRS